LDYIKGLHCFGNNGITNPSEGPDKPYQIQAKTPKTAKLGAKHKNLVATSLIMRAVR
jgi:hypothetical protein